MKISEAIEELQNLRNLYGDIPFIVRRYDQGHYGWQEATQAYSDTAYFQHDDGSAYHDRAAYIE